MIEFLLTFKVNDYHVATFFWNIFLALIPCLIAWRLSTAYYLKKWSHISFLNKALFSVIFLIWFFVFPNTAYLISDVRHLADYCDELDFFRVCVDEAWVVPVFFTYGLVGVPTFYYALKRITLVIEKLFGKTAKFLFPLLMIPITAFGLLLGLVARFNSWEVVSRPWDIMTVALEYMGDKTIQIDFAAYTVMLYLIYYTIDFIWKRKK